MTFTNLLSLEQIIAMKEPFAAVEITDADFNRIENIGDLIRHIEISDNETPRPAGVEPADRACTMRRLNKLGRPCGPVWPRRPLCVIVEQQPSGWRIR